MSRVRAPLLKIVWLPMQKASHGMERVAGLGNRVGKSAAGYSFTSGRKL